VVAVSLVAPAWIEICLLSGLKLTLKCFIYGIGAFMRL
jgi:hypothetical protein